MYAPTHKFHFEEYFLLVRRTLQINLNDEERAEVFGAEKN
jgi:hypothetical protein